MSEKIRDHIIIEDEQGNRKEFAVEALFDMRDDSYALLKSGNDETIVMKIDEENGQPFLSSIHNPIESEAILDTYQTVVQNEYGQIQSDMK